MNICMWFMWLRMVSAYVNTHTKQCRADPYGMYLYEFICLYLDGFGVSIESTNGIYENMRTVHTNQLAMEKACRKMSGERAEPVEISSFLSSFFVFCVPACQLAEMFCHASWLFIFSWFWLLLLEYNSWTIIIFSIFIGISAIFFLFRRLFFICCAYKRVSVWFAQEWSIYCFFCADEWKHMDAVDLNTQKYAWERNADRRGE